MGVQIVGRVASEPRENATRSGRIALSFSIPLRVYDDTEGKNQTEWVEVTKWFDQGDENIPKWRHMVGRGAVISAYGDLARRHYLSKMGEERTQLYLRYPKIDVVVSAPREQEVTQDVPRPSVPQPQPEMYDAEIPF